MRFEVVTIFPQMFVSVLNTSILGRAMKQKKIVVNFHNPRDFTVDKHHTVDDTPYSGGPGMIMKVEPLVKALKSIPRRRTSRTILLSAKGRRLRQEKMQQLSRRYDQLILICGRYEGVDERIKFYVDEELSVGDFVITGGEIAAMIIIDGVSRLLKGVLGKEESPIVESHSKVGYLEYPQYTRPEIFDHHRVPKVLLSGDHQRIQKWREARAKYRS